MRNAGLFVALFVVAFAVFGNRALDGIGCNARNVTVVARCAAFTRLTTATAPPAPLAAMAVRFAFTGNRFFAAGGFPGQTFGLDFGFDIERLFVVIGFLDQRREGGCLRRLRR